MINTQYINLNMTPSGVMPVLYVSQYDIGRPLGMVVYNGGETVDLDSYTCTIEATRTDGAAITAAVTTDDNIGAFVTTATMTNKADKYPAKLVLFDSNSRRVASLAFVMCVTPATMDENAESIEEDRSLYQQYTDAVQTALAEIREDVSNMENAFIAGVDVTRVDYTSEYTGRSRVYYAIIPAGNLPKLAMAGNPGSVQYPEFFLPDTTPTIMVNASTFNTGTGIPAGLVINDGEIIQENNLYGQTAAAEDHYVLYMDGDGNLQSVPAVDHTATQVKNAGAQWAIVAWDPIVMNGQYVSGHTDTDAQPRTVIGQDAGGRYFVMVCDGRLYESRGMSFLDIYNFVQSIGFSPRILYSLDGGQSSAFYSAGVRMNSYNGGTRRAIPNVIYFERGENTALMVTQKNRGVAQYYAEEPVSNYRPSVTVENIFNYVFKNAGTNGIRGIARTQDSSGQYVFSDIFKLGQSEDDQSVFLDGKVGGSYQTLISLLPSNALKLFGNEIFTLKSEGVDLIPSTTDFKTYVNNGVWFVGANNPYNPTSTDSFLVVFAYLASRFQILINPGEIILRTVDDAGSYASSWKTIYEDVTQTTVASKSGSGVSGTFYVTQKNGIVEIDADLTVSSPVASAQLNNTAFPAPKSTVVSQIKFSNNSSLRVNLDTSGALKFGSNVTPAGGSINSYGRVSIVYIAAN